MCAGVCVLLVTMFLNVVVRVSYVITGGMIDVLPTTMIALDSVPLLASLEEALLFACEA